MYITIQKLFELMQRKLSLYVIW